MLMVSLGCDKNLVDSEEMLGILAARGYEITDNEEEADAAVINTCCFIEDAKKESIREILNLAPLKKTGSLKALIVTGCMAQRYKDEIGRELPEVDAIVGTTGYASIADAVDAALEGKKSEYVNDISRDPEITTNRIVSTGGHYAFLKIAEGCDKNCTYCIIPKIRGHYRSIPMEKLVGEAERLAGKGVRELILVAQETTIYGTDLYGKKSLHLLLKRLCRIGQLKWIRILYCYPEEIYDELIDTIAEEEKICNYLDLPVQHASDDVLKRMNRHTTEAELRKLISELRNRIPGIILRTTLISGFPGETDEDHSRLLSFVKEMKFDRLGVFPYSREENTAAALMRPQISRKLKMQRRKELMELQQGISLSNGQRRIGEITTAVVDGLVPEEDVYVARTYGEAPGVDGCLFLTSSFPLESGRFVKVKITGASEYDLMGEVINEYTE